MKITYISVSGVKGVSASLNLKHQNLLIGGPMGSGKSALIDGVRMALAMPTPFGETGLDRLSPSQEWSVQICFEGGRVRMLERSMRRGKAAWSVNGMKVDKSEYAEAVKEVIDVEPHHVSLDEFINLSGQKRAAMFAAMLESASSQGVNDLLAEAHKTSLAQLATEFEVDLSSVIQKMRAIAGTPAQLCDGLRAIANGVKSDVGDCKTRLEGLIREQSLSSVSMSPVEVGAAVQKIDEQLGGLRARKQAIADGRDQYEAAAKLVTRAGGAVQKAKDALAAAQKLSDGLAEAQAALGRAEAECNDATAALAAIEADGVKLGDAAQELSEEAKKLKRGKEIVTEMFRQEWKVDPEWLDEEIRDKLLPILGDGVVISGHTHEAVIAIAKEIAAEVMGGDAVKLQEKIDANRSATAAHQEKVRAYDVSLRQGRERHRTAIGAADAARKALKDATAAAEQLPALQADVESCDAERARLEQAVQRTAAADDEAAIDGEIQSLTTERARLAGISRKLEESNAITGQVQVARKAVAAAEQAKAFADRVLEMAQRYRDNGVKDKLAQVMEPFTRSFKAVFGDAVQLKHRSGGNGRTTEFDFLIERRGIEVPFDLLSDGETILTAAAFLAALQSIKPGPGRFLSLNTEALDGEGLKALLRAIPSLGFDTVLIANNRADQHLYSMNTDRWQYIDMRERPREVAA
jgi:DNA repair exonuclease SbcCD ATPase subunit